MKCSRSASLEELAETDTPSSLEHPEDSNRVSENRGTKEANDITNQVESTADPCPEPENDEDMDEDEQSVLLSELLASEGAIE